MHRGPCRNLKSNISDRPFSSLFTRVTVPSLNPLTFFKFEHEVLPLHPYDDRAGNGWAHGSGRLRRRRRRMAVLGRAHTPGGAHVAGQGAQHGHSDSGQLGHGVSACGDGGRHVGRRAALEGEPHHVRLVVEVGRTRSEQVKEDWRDGNSGAGALPLGNGGYGAPAAVVWCRLGEGAGEGRRRERQRVERSVPVLYLSRRRRAGGHASSEGERVQHAACSSVHGVGTVYQFQISNSSSNIPLKLILRASVPPKPRRVSKNSINKSCISTYQLQFLLKLQSLIRPGLGDMRFQSGVHENSNMNFSHPRQPIFEVSKQH